jgi:hypothetical protein
LTSERTLVGIAAGSTRSRMTRGGCWHFCRVTPALLGAGDGRQVWFEDHLVVPGSVSQDTGGTTRRQPSAQ